MMALHMGLLFKFGVGLSNIINNETNGIQNVVNDESTEQDIVYGIEYVNTSNKTNHTM